MKSNIKRLSLNQRITIFAIIVIPIIAAILTVIIPIIHENLKQPKIEVYSWKCSESAEFFLYYFIVENKGGIAATNLEIHFTTKTSVKLTMEATSNNSSIITTPFLDSESGINNVTIKFPTFPPSSHINVLLVDYKNQGENDLNQFPLQRTLFPDGVSFNINRIWYDQGSFDYKKDIPQCVTDIIIPTIIATTTP